MKKTIIILMDAIREDYLKQMPFLNELKNKQTYISVIPSVGYSSGAHATIWSGVEQDRHNRFLIFYYKKNSKYFNFVGKIIKFIPKKLRAYFLSAIKLPYYKIPYLRRNPPKWYKKTIIDYPPGMPPEVAPYISTGQTELDYKHDLFEIFNKKMIYWTTQTDMDNFYFKKTSPKDANLFNLTKNDIDLYYFYFADGLAHEKGIGSKELNHYLKKIDTKIKDLITKAKENYNDFNYFIFSDHGMVEITDFVNVQSYLKKSSLKLGKDYIAFYDATMARFWVLNKDKEPELIKILQKIPKTTYFNKNLLKKYHLEFKTRMWFDHLLLMDPGVRPFPDYFVPIKTGVKAYHGYIPTHKNSKGVFLTNTFKTQKKEINIVEIMPTILKTLELDKEIPKDIDGKSII